MVNGTVEDVMRRQFANSSEGDRAVLCCFSGDYLSGLSVQQRGDLGTLGRLAKAKSGEFAGIESSLHMVYKFLPDRAVGISAGDRKKCESETAC